MTFLKRLLTSLLLLPLASAAQNNTNNLDVSVNTPLNFVISTASELDNDVTLTSALTLRLKTKASACHLYAKVTSITGNTSTALTPGYLKLKFRSGNGNYSNLNTQEIPLSYSNQLLFQQSKTAALRSYQYDFILAALGYDFYPGNYGFTVKFTMTQP